MEVVKQLRGLRYAAFLSPPLFQSYMRVQKDCSLQYYFWMVLELLCRIIKLDVTHACSLLFVNGPLERELLTPYPCSPVRDFQRLISVFASLTG